MRKRSIIGRIKTEISRIRLLDYAVSCIKNYNDEDMCNYMRNKSTNVFTIHGTKVANDREGIAYIINTGNSFSGFGAQFRRTLEALAFADYYGLVPYIQFTKDFLYSEDKPVNGKDNPFEYYFEQPTFKNVDEAYSGLFVDYQECHRRIIEKKGFYDNMYSVTEEYIEYMAQIIREYVKLNGNTDDYITQSFVSIGLDKEYIAVHVRGTDFAVGYKNHPKMVTLEDYFNTLDSIIEEDSAVDIFLATDEAKTIVEFQKRYGNKVRYYTDVFRSSDNSPVHFSNDSRVNHHYWLGMEILRDIITLSKGKYLIACNSQVSYCSRMFKKSTFDNYKEIFVLDKGINC